MAGVMSKDYRQIIEEIMAEQQGAEGGEEGGAEDLVQLIHGGRLDKRGGHRNRKKGTYHMHRKGGKKIPSPATAARRKTKAKKAKKSYSLGSESVKQNQPRGSDLQFPQEAGTTPSAPVAPDPTKSVFEMLKRLPPEQQKALIQKYIMGK